MKILCSPLVMVESKLSSPYLQISRLRPVKSCAVVWKMLQGHKNSDADSNHLICELLMRAKIICIFQSLISHYQSCNFGYQESADWLARISIMKIVIVNSMQMKTLPNLDRTAETVKYHMSIYIRIFVLCHIGQTSINFDCTVCHL